MSKYLISTTETYRVDSEEEVDVLLEEAKNSNDYTLSKYNCVHKELKKQGEVEDEWFRVTLTKIITSEKEPDRTMEVTYNNIGGGINSAF
jgi:hypothetical protein